MSKTRQPVRYYSAGWVFKAMAIPAIIVLVTAFQVSLVAAPAPTPQAAALATATPQLATSLVSISVLSLPTATPQPTATATLVPPTAPVIATGAPTLRPTPTPQPTPTLAFARPISVPVTAPAADGQQRTAIVPILMYHYVSDPPPGSDQYRWSLSVTPANLDAQMSYLKQAGYRTVTLYDLYDHLTQGKPLPEKPIILTFDDGYVDAFTQAMPILRKHGFVATFFILTGPADRGGAGGYLTWEQMQVMTAAGMDIELHSREHYDLRNRSNDFLVNQIAGGKEAIEAHIARPVRWFAYPSGHYDAAVTRVLVSAGFWGAVTTIPGRTHTAPTLFDMPRIRISSYHTLEAFKKAITEGQ
jgi:peptidoglycan/xylan/chitin deacetylase (PgdA/CDA1 family)